MQSKELCYFRQIRVQVPLLMHARCPFMILNLSKTILNDH
jgi:hypothetical protein